VQCWLAWGGLRKDWQGRNGLGGRTWGRALRRCSAASRMPATSRMLPALQPRSASASRRLGVTSTQGEELVAVPPRKQARTHTRTGANPQPCHKHTRSSALDVRGTPR